MVNNKNINKRIADLQADQRKKLDIPETHDPTWWDGLDDKKKKKIYKNITPFETYNVLYQQITRLSADQRKELGLEDNATWSWWDGNKEKQIFKNRLKRFEEYNKSRTEEEYKKMRKRVDKWTPELRTKHHIPNNYDVYSTWSKDKYEEMTESIKMGCDSQKKLTKSIKTTEEYDNMCKRVVDWSPEQLLEHCIPNHDKYSRLNNDDLKKLTNTIKTMEEHNKMSTRVADWSPEQRLEHCIPNDYDDYARLNEEDLKKLNDNTRFRPPTAYVSELAKAISFTEAFQFNHHCVGEDMNGSSDRFSKGRLNELSFVQFSGGRFKHVDEEGYDLVDTKTDEKVELKFVNGCLKKTPNGVFRENGYLKNIRIKNTMGPKSENPTSKLNNSTSENPTTPKLKNRADYYIFVDKTACAMAEYKDIEPFLVKKPDVIELEKMPMHKLCLLSSVPEINDVSRDYPKYKDYRTKMEAKLFHDFKAAMRGS